MSDLLLDALATHRLARLVTADMITAPLRNDIIRAAYAAAGDTEARRIQPLADVDWTERAHDDGEDAPKLAQWISCPWCAGFWCAAFVVIARRVAPGVWHPLAKALAFSSAAGLLRAAEHVAAI